MMRIITVTTALFFLLKTATAQSCIAPSKTLIIEPYHLSITGNKTTTLLFPYAIKSVDRGSRDVLAQKASGMENVLLVKAGKEHFPETNLTVITGDGKLYSILLRYSDNPYPINLYFISDSTLPAHAVVQEESNEAQLKSTAQKVLEKERTVYGIRDKNGKVIVRLLGIYIQNNVLYFKVGVQNHSNLAYEIEKVRFFIQDEQKHKRTTSQEIEMQPIYAYGDTAAIKSGKGKVLVFALPKFTIQDQKYGGIQLMEHGGSRLLELKVRNHTLVYATLLQE